MNPGNVTSNIIKVSTVSLAILAGLALASLKGGAPLISPQAHVQSALAKISLPVVEQEEGSYFMSVFSGSVIADDSGITYQLQGKDDSAVSFQETMVGGNTAGLTARGDSSTEVNTFYGNNPEEWKSNLKTFGSVWYEEVWEGIDVEVIPKKDSVEKFLYVSPGSRPELARFEVSDGSLSLDESGNLVISQPNGDYQMTAPVAWQDINGKRVDVEVSYEIMGSHYGFVLGDYNPNYELIVDPLLAGTYIGSGLTDLIYSQSIQVNDAGEVVVTGTVFGNPADTPTPGYDSYNGGLDVFVAKFDQDLAMTAISFIGSSSNEYSTGGLVIDSSGSIYIGGETFSSSFPTTAGVYDTDHSGWEAFVSKFSSDLSTLEASTFAGGFSSDEVTGLALNSDESSIYAVIKSNSDYLFPLGGTGYSQSDYGSQDAVVVKLSSDLQTIEAGTFFGTNGTDTVEDIVVDASDNVFITGEAPSGLPVTTGAYDETFNGVTDTYVAKFSSDLGTLVSATYIGGDNSDEGLALELDADQNVIVAGYSETPTSVNYPTTAGVFKTSPNGTDGVVSRFSNDLSTLMASTYLGGSSGVDSVVVRDVELASDGSIWTTGTNLSDSFPVSDDAYQTTFANNSSFATQLSSDLTEIVRSSVISGPFNDNGYSIALDAGENVIVGLLTNSSSSIATAGAYDETINGQSDIAIVYLDCEVSDSGEICLADTTGPQIQTLTPADDAINVSRGITEITIEFDEPVVQGDGVFAYLRDSSGAMIDEPLGYEYAVVSNESGVLTLRVDETLTYGESYYITIPEGYVRDLSGNDFAGITTTTDWNFTIEPNDGVAPILQSVTPANGATEIDPLADLVLTFNEAVGFESGTLKIYRKSDDQLIDTIDVAGTPSSGNGTTTLTLDRIETNLDYNTEYYVLVDSGALRDLTGTDFPGVADSSVWEFTTFSSPQVTGLSPANGATGVDPTANLVMTFNKPSGASSGTIRIYRSSDNTLIEEIDVAGGPQITGNGTSTITINPLSDLAAGTEYYVQIDGTAIRANQGPYFAGISDTITWTFSTLAATVPDESENDSEEESEEPEQSQPDPQESQSESPDDGTISPISVTPQAQNISANGTEVSELESESEDTSNTEIQEEQGSQLSPQPNNSDSQEVEEEPSEDTEATWYFATIPWALVFLAGMSVLGYISRKR